MPIKKVPESNTEAKGFIHERIIYEYMKHRVNYGNLKMNHIIHLGERAAKSNKVNVDYVKILNTHFPDIDKIIISDNRSSARLTRVAEVKFLTSEFNYHKEPRFNEFAKKHGCIIVLKHDSLPSGLKNIDVYELDRDDFKSYVRENFDRLLSGQIMSRDHDDYKIWLFSQAPNFYKKMVKSEALPANESNIWCPTKTRKTD